MNVFTQSISRIFKGAAKAFQTFPTAIASALGFAIVTMIKIQLEWPQQEAYNFLFNCLHWSFALGAVFSLAVITAAQSRYNDAKAFRTANLVGAAAVVATFLALYLFGGTHPDLAETRFAVISGLAASRVGTAMLVSFIAFIWLAGYPEDQSDFARAFFMTHKAFFIALLYGGVILGGASGVAGVVEALLYRGMSEKVYMYIATLSGFLAFTIFAGYFPDFRKGTTDERREIAQMQPRFVEILFEYITIPIMLALSAVLLLWAGKTMMEGMRVPFIRLAGIATAYTMGGIWLHVMVTRYETGLAKFYRRIYPIAALVILAFEAWAFVIQLQKTGLKMAEYSFIVIWIIALVSAVLLLVMKAQAHHKIAVLTCIMAVLTVLPMVGYHALPVTAQVGRLENLLVGQGMLENNQLIPAPATPELAVRQSITDAVTYLAFDSNAELPSWFDKRLGENEVFKVKLGFEQAWPAPEEPYNQGSMDYMSTHLELPLEVIDISDYRWAVKFGEPMKPGMSSVISIDGEKGVYQASWTVDPETGIPTLKITKEGRVILEQNLKAYVDQISEVFPPGKSESSKATVKDLSLQLETPEVKVLLVFSTIDINADVRADRINYWLNLNVLYLNEKK